MNAVWLLPLATFAALNRAFAGWIAVAAVVPLAAIALGVGAGKDDGGGSHGLGGCDAPARLAATGLYIICYECVQAIHFLRLLSQNSAAPAALKICTLSVIGVSAFA